MTEPTAPKPGRRARLGRALKSGVEALSGLSMQGVRVRTDSARPAGLPPSAQGAPGWHIEQAPQPGRVHPPAAAPAAPPQGDDALEREADALGRRAMEAAKPPRPRP